MSTPIRIDAATYRSCGRLRLACVAGALIVLALALGMTACGGGPDAANRVRGGTLTVYASLPRHGVSARSADAVAAGERLALSDAHARAGGRRVRLVELDSSDPTGESWDPSAVQANAKRAASDPTTIAYIGELNFGGSAVSVPVTNGAGVLQVSPMDGLTSLTQVDPDAPATSPERYYPRGRRTFLRLVPTDLLQAATLIAWAHARGAHQVAIVHDDQLFGRELAAQAVLAARRLQMTLGAVVEAGPDPATYPALAQKVAQSQPDAVVYTGLGGQRTGPLLSSFAGALPHARLYGSSSLATAAPPPAGLPDLAVASATRPRSLYGPAAGRVLDRLEAELGAPIGPEALYGYEAMRLVLDAINAAGRNANRRDHVVAQALRPRTRRSLLGAYRISGTGDTSFTAFAAYRLSGGRLRYEGLRVAGAAAPAPEPDVPGR